MSRTTPVTSTNNTLTEQATYDPNRLLDTLIKKLQLKNDAALSEVLDISRPVLSKIRHRRIPVGPILLIRIHETSGLSISELRALMGDCRRKYRVSDRVIGQNRD